MSKVILVFGATGLQGKALIRTLVESDEFEVIALSRDPSSSSSIALANLPRVKVLKVAENCMDEPELVFDTVKKTGTKVYGVFSCQSYVDDATMVKQGIAIADAAQAAGVQHFIYSSADFGGLDDTHVSTYEVKRIVENHILKLGIPHTFLRPVQFMDNFLPDAGYKHKLGKTVFLRLTYCDQPDKIHQVVSGKDIGVAGARAFVEGPGFMDGVVRLAGDGMTVREMEKIYKEVMGVDIPLAPYSLSALIKHTVGHLKEMSVFMEKHGFNVDIPALRKEIPEIEDWRGFLTRFKARQS